jgi:hypothetical protein
MLVPAPCGGGRSPGGRHARAARRDLRSSAMWPMPSASVAHSLTQRARTRARQGATVVRFGLAPYRDAGGRGGGVVAAGTVEGAAGAAAGIVTTPELAAGVAAGAHIDS